MTIKTDIACQICCNPNVPGDAVHSNIRANKLIKNNSQYGENTYRAMQRILAGATGGINFWGTRVVYLEGHKGSISLKNLKEHVVQLIKSNPEYTETDRTHGRVITTCLDERDSEADEAFKKMNWLKKLITKIVGLFRFRCANGGNDWDITWRYTFDKYTESQFKIKTGKTPKEAYGNCVNACECGGIQGIRLWFLPDSPEGAKRYKRDKQYLEERRKDDPKFEFLQRPRL